MNKLPYTLFTRIGADQLAWRLDSRRLRILCYHGIYEDSLDRAPWIPQFFVAKSAFEEQLQYLQRRAHVLPLSEAVIRLREGSLPPRAVCLTFDDGYANNLHLAYPLLVKYRAHATIFLSTRYIESGDMFPFLKLRLVRMWSQRAGARSHAAPLLEYKSNPLDQVMERAEELWQTVGAHLNEDQFRTLRPLVVSEVIGADSRFIEFGAHGHTHCILRNETPQRRSAEIRTSLAKVAQWTGQKPLFSYPNGQRGDFNQADQATLRAEGVAAAVTGISGANGCRSDLLQLKRYPIGMYHDSAGFRAEVTGFRSILLAATRRTAS